MLKLQIQGGLQLGVEDHLASSLLTGESRTVCTLPHAIPSRQLKSWWKFTARSGHNWAVVSIESESNNPSA